MLLLWLFGRGPMLSSPPCWFCLHFIVRFPLLRIRLAGRERGPLPLPRNSTAGPGCSLNSRLRRPCFYSSIFVPLGSLPRLSPALALAISPLVSRAIARFFSSSFLALPLLLRDANYGGLHRTTFCSAPFQDGSRPALSLLFLTRTNSLPAFPPRTLRLAKTHVSIPPSSLLYWFSALFPTTLFPMEKKKEKKKQWKS